MNEEIKKKYIYYFGERNFNKLLDLQKKKSNDQFIRINLSIAKIEEIIEFLKSKRIKFSYTFFENAIKIEKSYFNISSSLLALSGYFYIQDLASQIPVNSIDIDKFKSKNKKLYVLDMCSSPGSKITQLYDLFNYHKLEFEIIGIEKDENRIKRLINNIQKQGCENIKIFNIDALNFSYNKKFDIILLDAPCSGNLIGDKNWLFKRNQKGIIEKSNLQKRLLKKANILLKEDGELIYSTCSLEIEENEENVEWILKNSDLKNVDIHIDFGFKVNPLKNVKAIRLMPYYSNTQGFFISKFVK